MRFSEFSFCFFFFENFWSLRGFHFCIYCFLFTELNAFEVVQFFSFLFTPTYFPLICSNIGCNFLLFLIVEMLPCNVASPFVTGRIGGNFSFLFFFFFFENSANWRNFSSWRFLWKLFDVSGAETIFLSPLFYGGFYCQRSFVKICAFRLCFPKDFDLARVAGVIKWCSLLFIFCSMPVLSRLIITCIFNVVFLW